MPFRFISSILVRTSALVLAVAMAIGLVTSEAAGRLAGRVEAARSQEEILGLISVVELSAGAACFTGDLPLLEETVQGLLNAQSLGQAEISDGQRILAAARRPGVHRLGPALVRPLKSPFTAEPIGELRVFPDLEVSQRRSEHYVWFMRGLALLLAGVVGAALAWTMAHSVVRPIQQMSDQLHRLVPTEGMRLRAPGGHERDEFGRLVGDVNALVGRLADALREEHHLRLQEDAVRQAQKLESLGLLAGGIAHDFNNLLGAMLGNLNLAQMKLPEAGGAARHLDNLTTLIGKASGLCRQMLAYSGGGSFVVEPLLINALVPGISELLATTLGPGGRLEFELEPELPAIEADASQIQQVLMNLVTNAADAIRVAGGVVTVRTARRWLEADDLAGDLTGDPGGDLARQGLEPGEYVSLIVSDTGCGMDAATRARIFDPFFSTKGSGRGLGLSAMLGILHSHKAGIEIQSEPGRGSRFEVLFRASALQVAVPPPVPPATRGGVSGGRILLVDDDEDLRFALAAMLGRLGFQVEEAEDGLAGVEAFSPGAFAMVLMDLTMPRLDGRSAFLRMLELDPAVRVIMISGYSEQEAFGTLGSARPAGFIEKPFDFQVLKAEMERVLG